MSAEFVRDALFRPFQSTKKSGLGIGMFQARHRRRGAPRLNSCGEREGQGDDCVGSASRSGANHDDAEAAVGG